MFCFLLSIWTIYLADFSCSLRRSHQRTYLSGLMVLFFCFFFIFFSLWNSITMVSSRLSFFDLSDFIFEKGNFSLFLFLVILFLGICLYISFFDGLFFNYSHLKEQSFLLVSLIFTTSLVILCCDFVSFVLLIELQTFLILLLLFGFGFMQQLESSLKFFMISGFSASLNLLGISIIFVESGLFNFLDLSLFLDQWFWVEPNINLSSTSSGYVNSLVFFFFENGLFWINLGLLFIFLNIFIKIGFIGFHQWIPDVYDGASELGFISLSILSKITGLFLLFRFSLFFSTLYFYSYWIIFLMLISILSLCISLFHNLYQLKIRKFFAFSSIAQMGYISCCLVLNSAEGFVFGICFSLFYIFGLFTILLIFSLIFFADNGNSLVHIREVLSISQSNGLSFVVIVSFLNFIGTPPMFTFLFKFFIIGLLGTYDYYYYFFFCLFFFLLSIQSMFYYLRFIRFFLVDSLSIIKRSVLKISEFKANFTFFLVTVNFWLIIYGDFVLINVLNLFC